MDDLDEAVNQPGKVVVLLPLTHFLPPELLRAGLRVSRVQVVVDDETNVRRGVCFSAEGSAGTGREAYLADSTLPQLRRAISRIFREWKDARANHSTREVRFVARKQLRIAARVTGPDCAAEFVVGV